MKILHLFSSLLVCFILAQPVAAGELPKDSCFTVLHTWEYDADTVDLRIYRTAKCCEAELYGFLIMKYSYELEWNILWARGESERSQTQSFIENIGQTAVPILITLFTDEDNMWGNVHRLDFNNAIDPIAQSITIPYLLHDDYEITEGALYEIVDNSSITFNGTTYEMNKHINISYDSVADSLIITLK
jgi:hypothetical protein